jgi:hypothetical protein
MNVANMGKRPSAPAALESAPPAPIEARTGRGHERLGFGRDGDIVTIVAQSGVMRDTPLDLDRRPGADAVAA